MKLSEEDARMITAQLLLTVDFMARKNIVHRDLKPENLLLRSKVKGIYDIRIADFGFATIFDPTKPLTSKEKEFVCGTAGYLAPEILNLEGHSLKSDLFSVGCILYSLLTLKSLFSADTYKEMVVVNRACDISHMSQHLRRCSLDAKDLVKQLLHKNPARRPSAKDALKHPWFKEEELPLQSSITLNKLLADSKLGSQNWDSNMSQLIKKKRPFVAMMGPAFFSNSVKNQQQQ